MLFQFQFHQPPLYLCINVYHIFKPPPYFSLKGNSCNYPDLRSLSEYQCCKQEKGFIYFGRTNSFCADQLRTLVVPLRLPHD